MADKGKVNYDTFVMRHGLFRNLPKGKLGEPLYCTDTHELYIGQGEDKSPIPVVAQGGSGTDVNGMFFSVDTIAERDALKYTYNVQNGAMCYVAEEDMYYKYSNGEWGEANFGTGGGGTTGSLTSDMAEDLTLSVNSDLRISYFFSSPNAGKGNLKVFINGVEVVSESISQGAGVVTVPESAFTKGASHTLVMYVIDRAEIFTNSLTFYVVYGGLEISTTFDSASSYDVGSIVRCYYTPTSVKTLPIKLYVKIDGELQEPLSCTANTRNTYTFPRTLDAGSHNIQMWVADADGTSNVLMFPLILLSSDSLVITSTKTDVEVEEGDQVSLDYKVSMKNQTAFNTKYYIDEVLIQSGTCGVVKTFWNTSTLTKGNHTLKLYVETQATGDDGQPLATSYYTWNVLVVESSYQTIKHLTAGLMGGFTAQDRTNTNSDKEYWIGTDEEMGEVIGELYNYGYDNTCGWVDNSLISNGKAYTKIPIRPLATNGGKQGVTIEIEFSSKDIGVENAVVLDCYDTGRDCGIKITKDKAIMKSFSGNSINLEYSEQTNTHIVLVLDRLDKMAKGYINGVLCEAFYLADTGEGDGAVLEDFTVNKDVYLNGSLNADGDVEGIGWSKIKNVRFYNVALTSEEVVNNYLANITDKDAQRAKSQFQRGVTLPTMTFTGSTKGMGKGSPKTMKITYNSTDEIQYGKSFELKNCSVEWQGTSSLQYVVKNYKIKLKDDSGNKYKYNPFGEGNALPESTFCLKADYMESSHANNTGLAKFITKYLYEGDTIDYSPPRQVYEGVRDTITGFPIRLVINDVQDDGSIITKDMGIFNFNLDKGCTDSFGLNTANYPNCISYEVVANSDVSAGAFFSYGYRIDSNTVAGSEFDTELAYLQNSFELRYPDEDDVGSDYGYLTKLKRVIDWVCKTPVGTEDEKKAFRDQFVNYFDKGYTLRYLLCVLVFGMVDNLGKNMMLDTWDGQIWYPRFYDLDTSWGLDNSGVLDIPSDCEIVAGTFNTSNSQLWSKVMIAFENELRTEYQYMRSGKFNEANIMEFMYGEQISKIPESYYNSDAQTKYLDFGALYLSKLHGNRYEHMKKWIKRRLLYVDTLLNYTSTTDDSITVRAGTLQTIQFKIETFEPQYVRIKWKNGETRKYRCDGKTPTVCEYKLDTETDQEILIYNASNLKRLGGLSSAVPESMDLANAVRLSELEVHSTKLKNINGTTSGGVNVSSMTNLNKINLSGCTALEGALNVAGCTMLQYINIQDTNMADVQLPPTGAALSEIWYSKTVQTIMLQGAPNLKILGLQQGNSCKSLTVIDCPNIEAFGQRKFDAASRKYTDHPYANLEGVQQLTLDNSHISMEVFQLKKSTGLTKLVFRNMPNLKEVQLGASRHSTSNYSGSIVDNLALMDDFSIEASACPNFKTFRITSTKFTDWYMYPDCSNFGHLDGASWSSFSFKTIDLSKTNITKFYANMGVHTTALLLPTTTKELVINKLVNHTQLNKKSIVFNQVVYSTEGSRRLDYNCDVLTGGLTSQTPGYAGNYIEKMYNPDNVDPNTMENYEFNFSGFSTFDEFSIHHLGSGHNETHYNTSYAPYYKNISVQPTKYPVSFLTRNIENVTLDFSKYYGEPVRVYNNMGDEKVTYTGMLPNDYIEKVEDTCGNCEGFMYNSQYKISTTDLCNKWIPFVFKKSYTMHNLMQNVACTYLDETHTESNPLPTLVNDKITSAWENSSWCYLPFSNKPSQAYYGGYPLFIGTNWRYFSEIQMNNLTDGAYLFANNNMLKSGITIADELAPREGADVNFQQNVVVNRLILPKCTSLGWAFAHLSHKRGYAKYIECSPTGCAFGNIFEGLVYDTPKSVTIATPPTSLGYAFGGSTGIVPTIPDLSLCTNFSRWIEGTSIDVDLATIPANFNGKEFFYGYLGTDDNVKNFDSLPIGITSMAGMYRNTTNLVNKVYKPTENHTALSDMSYAYSGISADLRGTFTIPINVTTIAGMLEGAFQSVDPSDTSKDIVIDVLGSKLKDISRLFVNCRGTKGNMRINFSQTLEEPLKWEFFMGVEDGSATIDKGNLYINMDKVRELDKSVMIVRWGTISNWDCFNLSAMVTDITQSGNNHGLFFQTNVPITGNVVWTGTLTHSFVMPWLTTDSSKIDNFISHLGNVSGKTLTLWKSMYNALSSAQKSAITSKGWTVISLSR